MPNFNLSKTNFSIHKLLKILALTLLIFFLRCLVPFNAETFSFHLARTTDAFCCFTCFLFRWFFVITTQFHFAETTFTLHFFLYHAQSLFNIVVMNDDCNYGTHLTFILRYFNVILIKKSSTFLYFA